MPHARFALDSTRFAEGDSNLVKSDSNLVKGNSISGYKDVHFLAGNSGYDSINVL